MQRFIAPLVAAGLALGLTAGAFADSVNMSFNSAGDTAGWYKDRYAPQVFDSGVSGGGRSGVLQLGVRESGQSGNRGGSYDSDFYNYQGMKYDLGMEGHVRVSVDMFVDSTWDDGSRAGMWTTMSNGNASFPIIEYVVGATDMNAPSFTGFRFWQSGLGWSDTGVAVSQDTWNRLSIELDGSSVLFYLNGTHFSTVSSNGAHGVDNVILQAHNMGIAGEYDAYFDNLSAAVVPTPSAALGGLALMGLPLLRRRAN